MRSRCIARRSSGSRTTAGRTTPPPRRPWTANRCVRGNRAAAPPSHRQRPASSRGAVHLARARLLYGEWLRRENRRVDAREQLRAADEIFSEIGAQGFSERARRELLATGETARTRTDDARGVLTSQEAHIARLARDGLSNPEIGSQLFISPRTVQYHLRKVFLKLDIGSRNQLSRVPASHLKTA